MAMRPLPSIFPATYDDLSRVPDHLVAEIVDGDLVVSPRPAPRHAAASSALGAELGGPFQRGRGGPGGWWILDEPELHLGSDVLVPDLAGWRRERLPRLPREAYFALAPDWVCEVVSPSTERLDRVRKMRLYGAAAVRHLWLVNATARTLEVYRLEGDIWARVGAHAESEVVRAEPFEGIALELEALWADVEAESDPGSR
jgi:Uma2 family endonuclease